MTRGWVWSVPSATLTLVVRLRYSDKMGTAFIFVSVLLSTKPFSWPRAKWTEITAAAWWGHGISKQHVSFILSDCNILFYIFVWNRVKILCCHELNSIHLLIIVLSTAFIIFCLQWYVTTWALGLQFSVLICYVCRMFTVKCMPCSIFHLDKLLLNKLPVVYQVRFFLAVEQFMPKSMWVIILAICYILKMVKVTQCLP